MTDDREGISSQGLEIADLAQNEAFLPVKFLTAKYRSRPEQNFRGEVRFENKRSQKSGILRAISG